MTSIFSKIIDGEIPAHSLYEDEYCIVILDKFPATRGQALVIPKKEVDYAFDMDDHLYIHCFTIARRMVKALDAALEPKRTCLVVEGFEVPHAHIKLFPCFEKKLPRGGKEVSDEELTELARLITKQLS